MLLLRCAEFKVLVQSSLRDPSRIGADHIMLQAAQPDMVKTIAYLLAQTVALHFYEMCAHPRMPFTPSYPIPLAALHIPPCSCTQPMNSCLLGGVAGLGAFSAQMYMMENERIAAAAPIPFYLCVLLPCLLNTENSSPRNASCGRREVDNQLKIFQDINLAIEASGDFRPAGKAGGSKDNLMRMVKSFCPLTLRRSRHVHVVPGS